MHLSLNWYFPPHAEQIAGDIAELEILESKASQTAGSEDLPDHVKECELEIGILARRIVELKAEISWASSEIEKRKEDGAAWDRLLTLRRNKINRLKLQEAELREQEEFAHKRALEAAKDAHEPAEWAKRKAEEALAVKALVDEWSEESTSEPLEANISESGVTV